MTNDNQDALRCAQSLTLCVGESLGDEVAAHLRRLVRENEAKDALLRQAVEALEQAKHNTTHGQIAWNCKEVIAAIRLHLEGRASQKPTRCQVCGGRGRVNTQRGEDIEEVDCRACHGDGTIGA